MPKRAQGYQTQPNKANKLTIRVWPRDAATEDDPALNKGESNPFSVAAIPLRMQATYDKPIFVRGPGFIGMRVKLSLTSDSGEDRTVDLKQVYTTEVVKIRLNTLGAKEGAGSSSGYTNENVHQRNPDHVDGHAIRIALLVQPGILEVKQAFVFKELRTGSVDMPVPESGFLIKYDWDTTEASTLITTKAGIAIDDTFDVKDGMDKRTGVAVKVQGGKTSPAQGAVQKWKQTGNSWTPNPAG